MNQNKLYSSINLGVVSLLVAAYLFSQAGVPIPVQAEGLGSQKRIAANSPSIGGCPMFPSNNIWNTPINTLPVHTHSDQWVNTIGRNTGFHMDFGSGTWDGGPIGIPYNVGAVCLKSLLLFTIPMNQILAPIRFRLAL